MARINLEALSVSDLVVLEEKLKSAIDDARERQRLEIKAKIAGLAEQHGFSVSELFGGGRGPHRKKTPATAKNANPSDPTEKWSGRGRRPGWVVALLKKGKKLEDFAI